MSEEKASDKPNDSNADAVRPGGALAGAVAALRAQVSMRTAKSHELISAQMRMQSLLHNASDAILQFDADATIVAFNRAAERVFGYNEIELMYQSGAGLFRFPGRYSGDVPRDDQRPAGPRKGGGGQIDLRSANQ